MQLTIGDLRIGNLIQTGDGKIGAVQFITNQSVSFKNTEGAAIENEATFKAVPITSEWLSRFGFMKCPCCGSMEIQFDEITAMCVVKRHGAHIEDEIQWLVELTQLVADEWEEEGDEEPVRESVELSHIQYVHQLQNLFYSVSGQELQMLETFSDN